MVDDAVVAAVTTMSARASGVTQCRTCKFERKRTRWRLDRFYDGAATWERGRRRRRKCLSALSYCCCYSGSVKNGSRDVVSVVSGAGVTSVSSSPPHRCHRSSPSFVVLLLCLLMLPHVSHECPTTCQCNWKGGKETVACFRASLTKIPHGLDPGTQVLNMTENSLKTLPGNVFLSLNLLNLQKIHLPNCDLVSIDRHAFNKLTNLVELDLSGNRLEFIPTHSFATIPELRELRLNYNKISRIQSDAFVPLRRLVRLELTNCKVGIIEPWAFRELPALEWLRLDKNILHSVQAESFFPLQSLHGLKMSGNPWNCSCALKPLRDWMLRNNVPFEGVPPVCKDPERLKDQSWDKLELEDFACLPRVQAVRPEEKMRKVVEGQNTTFVCRLQATADTRYGHGIGRANGPAPTLILSLSFLQKKVTWLMGNKGLVVTNGTGLTGGSGGAGFLVTESFVWRSEDVDEIMTNGHFNSGHLHIPHATVRQASSSLGHGLDKSVGTKISTLSLFRIGLREAGHFFCRGESRAGIVSANFSLVVLQNKVQQNVVPGRLLFTSTVVAAIMTVLICLLLSCLCFVARFRKLILVSQPPPVHSSTPNSPAINSGSNNCRTTTLAEDKIELNHVTVVTARQNGGVVTTTTTTASATGGLPLENNHNHVNSIATRLPNNNIHPGQWRPPPPERVGEYKAVPTADPDDDHNQKVGSGGGSDGEKNRVSVLPEVQKDDNGSERQGQIRNQEPRSAKAVMTRSTAATATTTSDGLDRRQLEPSKSMPTALAGGTTGGGLSSEAGGRIRDSGGDKFPDLIDGKMSTSSNLDFISLPRPSRMIHDSLRGSYFHRRINSDSQSPLLSGGHTSGSNSAEIHSLTSTESLVYSPASMFSSVGAAAHHSYQSVNVGRETGHFHHQQQQHHHHQQRYHHPSSSSSSMTGTAGYHRSGGSGGHYHRLSMPTSPVRETGPANSSSSSAATSYDYHAAQLAVFLEEYRVLQLELMRMSASLNQQSGEMDNPAASLASPSSASSTAVAGSYGGNRMPTTASTADSATTIPDDPSRSFSTLSTAHHHHIHPNAQQPAPPLKSILKNPSGSSYIV